MIPKLLRMISPAVQEILPLHAVQEHGGQTYICHKIISIFCRVFSKGLEQLGQALEQKRANTCHLPPQRHLTPNGTAAIGRISDPLLVYHETKKQRLYIKNLDIGGGHDLRPWLSN